MAAAVSVCCSGPAIGPLLVAWFGVGGAVAIEGLRPYAPSLVAVSGVILGWSFWRTYRRVRCAPGRPPSALARTSTGLLYLSVAVWLVAATAVTYGVIHG